MVFPSVNIAPDGPGGPLPFAVQRLDHESSPASPTMMSDVPIPMLRYVLPQIGCQTPSLSPPLDRAWRRWIPGRAHAFVVEYLYADVRVGLGPNLLVEARSAAFLLDTDSMTPMDVPRFPISGELCQASVGGDPDGASGSRSSNTL